MIKVWTQINIKIHTIVCRIKKPLLDMASTCYEDQRYEVMSLPLLAFFISIWLMVVATVAEQFFGHPFSHYGELVAFVGTSAASYVGKKFTDRDRGMEAGTRDE